MNLIFLGAPGSGKGTQAKRLCNEYNLVHLSTGDMLRDAVRKQTKTGLEAKKYLDAGMLVADATVIAIVNETISNINQDFILDGFPRTINQAEALEDILESNNKKIDFVIYFEADLENLIVRIVNRLVCPKCGTVYNKLIKMPQFDHLCDNDNTPLVQRSDDSEQKAVLRIQTYLNETLPLVEFYQDDNLLHVVDANQSSDLVFKNIQKILEQV